METSSEVEVLAAAVPVSRGATTRNTRMLERSDEMTTSTPRPDANGTGSRTNSRAETSRSRETNNNTETDNNADNNKNTESTGGSQTSSEQTVKGGEEILELTDFTLDGPLPLVWQRTYRTTAIDKNTGLGHGWAHPFSQQLRIEGNQVYYDDTEGRSVYFNLPGVGFSCRNRTEKLTLHRHSTNHYSIGTDSGLGVKHHFRRQASLHSRLRQSSIFELYHIDDGFGHKIDLTRQDGRVTQVDTSEGNCLRFAYDRHHQITRIERRITQETAQASQPTWAPLIRYSYDDAHDLVTSTNANEQSQHYRYQQHVIVQRTLETGYNFYFEWDQHNAHARCQRNWGDPIQGKSTYDYHFEWDPDNRESHIIDTRGGRISYRFNDKGLPLSIRNPEGDITYYQYNRDGQCIRNIDPLGHSEYFAYNKKGHLTRYTNKRGHQFRFTLNSQGMATAITDPAGNTTRRNFTDQGLLSSITDANNNQTHYRYTDKGLLNGVTNALGDTITYLWDNHSRLTAIRDPLGNHTLYSYNNQGKVTRITRPDGNITEYQYDAQQHCIRVGAPEGQATEYTYTPLGLLASITDPTGRTTHYDYDGLSQVVRRTNTLGQTLEYEYDGERNLIGLTNENGEHYRLGYDLNERLISETGFDGRHQIYQYNRGGQLIASKALNTNGAVINHTDYQRDTDGRLLEQKNHDDTTSRFAYDILGRVTQANNHQRTLAWHYNPLGQVTDAYQDEHRLVHHYDPIGQRIGTELPNGDHLEYQFDQNQQFTGLLRNRESLIQLDRDIAGRELLRTLNNQLETQSHYDPQGRLTAQTTLKQNAQRQNGAIDPVISQRQYHYNTEGQLSQIDDAHKGSTHYLYDPLDRLTQVNGPVPERFVFDPASNLLSMQSGTDESADNGTENREQAAENTLQNKTPGNRLAFQGDVHYLYDEHGNRTQSARGKAQKLKTHYHYNAQHQLIAVDKEGQTTTFTYDALGRRIEKATAEHTTTFVWNDDVLLSEQTEDNHTKETTSDKTYLHEPYSFKPVALIENDETYHYHLDHLGTPQEITNAHGRVVWSASFKAYGNLAVAHVNEIENNIRFQGQYADGETGLHYNRFRYYDPGCGQFTTQDPIGLLGGSNSYQYVPNPTSWVDPLGLTAQKESPTRQTEAVANSKPDFYVGPSGADSTMPSTAYRYMGYKKRRWFSE